MAEMVGAEHAEEHRTREVGVGAGGEIDLAAGRGDVPGSARSGAERIFLFVGQMMNQTLNHMINLQSMPSRIQLLWRTQAGHPETPRWGRRRRSS